MLTATSVYVWKYVEHKKIQEITLKNEIITEQIVTHYQDRLESHLAILKFLRREWFANKINTPLDFERVVLSLIRGFPGFQAINYIDSTGVIRWVQPEETNIEAKDKDLHDHPFAAETFIKAEKTGDDYATPALELWQGGMGIAIYFPLIREGRLEGYLNGVFRLNDFIQYYFKQGIAQKFCLHLKEDGREFYISGDEISDHDHPITSDYPVSILNREWTASLSPRPELIKATASYANLFILILSIVLWGIFAYVIHLSIIRRREVYKSEKKYRDLFEKSDDAILIIKNGKFVDCNQATVKMLRYNNKKELLNTHPSELSPEKQPDGKSSFEKADEMMNIALEKGSHRFEWDHKKANGEVFPVEVLLTYIPTDDENTIIHTVWRDMTERKQADRLQSVVYQISEATHSAKNIDELYKVIHTSLKQVLDVTNFYIAIYDEKTELLSFPYFVDESDIVPAPKPLGRGLTEYIIQTKKPVFLKEKDMIEMISQEKIDQIGTLPRQWVGSPFFISGKINGAIAMQSYHDSNLYTKKDLDILNYVSEQIAQTIAYKQSITDLEVERTYLDELFTNSPEAVALVDNESLILKINPEFTSLFGYAEEDIIGKNIDGLLTDREQLKNAEKLTHEVRTGRRVFVEAIRRKKDGTMLPVSILGAPINYKGGVLAVYAIYRDISERKEAEAQLKSSERKHRLLSKQLTESNMMKETLLDIISHDLKNPAGVILGFSELLQEENSDNEIVTGIIDSSKNLIKVIDNVSTLSKVTLGEKIKLKSLDLVRVIEQVSDEYKSQFASKGMELYLNLPDSLQVQANPIVAEIFKNYLSNALKYSSDGKKVIIDTAIDENSITIHFIDFGPTVPKEKREIIFVRGSQLEKGAKRGRGLGLAIAKRIADAHNGQVWVEPNEPTGNRFCFEIPK